MPLTEAGVSCVGPRPTAPARTTLLVGPKHEWSELDLADFDLLVVSLENDGVTLSLFLRRAGEARHRRRDVRLAAQQVRVGTEIVDDHHVDARLRFGDLVALGSVALRL